MNILTESSDNSAGTTKCRIRWTIAGRRKCGGKLDTVISNPLEVEAVSGSGIYRVGRRQPVCPAVYNR